MAEVEAGYLSTQVERLLERDLDAHEEAVAGLADRGDERVIPHLVEVAQIDAVANNWARFGFPEVLRDGPTPRHLAFAETRWPGVINALRTLGEPDFDSEIAWLQWETWLTQQQIKPLGGYEAFAEWKLDLFKRYHPLLGMVLDTEPRMDNETFAHLRGAVADIATLHALNTGRLRPAREDDYVGDGDLVFGFTVGGEAYAVPRWMIFPHEAMNVQVAGRALNLSYCTLCDAPVLYDRDVGGRTLTLACAGWLLHGNKVMYDDETESLWSQQTGTPLAGPARTEGHTLDRWPVSQASWAEWRAANPDTYLLDRETGYDYDYEYYREYDGFIARHYWDREDLLLPGLPANDTELGDGERVFGVQGETGRVHVYPVEAVAANEPVIDSVDGRDVVVLARGQGAAAYEAPPRVTGREGAQLLADDDTAWTIDDDGLYDDDGRLAYDRHVGMHARWWSFRPKYDDYVIVRGTER